MDDDKKVKIIYDLVDNVSGNVKKVSGAVNQVDQHVGSLSKNLVNLAGHFKDTFAEGAKQLTQISAFAGTAALGFIGFGAKVAADLETARNGFITLLGSAEQADEILAMIKKDAASTPFEFKGLVQANQLLTAVTKDGKRSEKILMDVGKALAAMGKGQNELDRIIVNLQQIGAVGKASMMDIKQFAFAGIPIFEMLSETFGKNGEALEEFINDGGVTFAALEQMFAKAAAEGGRFEKAFTNQLGAMNQILANLGDNFQMLAADIVTDSGLFDTFKDVLMSVNEFLDKNREAIINLVKTGIENLKVALNQVLETGRNVLNWIIDLGQKIGITSTDVENFTKVFAALTAAIIAGSVIIGIISSPLTILVVAIGLVSAAVVALKKAWDENFLGIQTTITEKVLPVIQDLVTKFRDGFEKLVNSPAVQRFLEMVREMGTQIGENLQKAFERIQPSLEQLRMKFEELWPKIQPIVEALGILAGIIIGVVVLAVIKLVEIFTSLLAPAIDTITSVLSWLMDAIGSVVDFMNQNVIPIFVSVGDTFKEVARVISDIINNLIIPVFQILGYILGQIFNEIKRVVTDVFNAFRPIIQPVIDFFTRVLQPAVNQTGDQLKGVFGSVRSFIEGAWQGIQSAVRGSINWIIERVNEFIRSVNGMLGKLDEFGSQIGVKVSFRIGEIPKLAQGINLVPNDMLALIHKNEAVVPAHLNPYNPDANTNGLGAGTVNATFNIYGATDADGVSRAIMRDLSTLMR